MFELRQLQEVLLQGFLVGVDLLQFVLQLLKGGLPTVNTHTVLWINPEETTLISAFIMAYKIFIILALYTDTMDLKLNNHDVL